jgi:hypothetical protein
MPACREMEANPVGSSGSRKQLITKPQKNEMPEGF